jgi:hypothetical protein
MEDVVLDAGRAFVGGEAEIEFDWVGDFVDRVAGGEGNGVVVLRLHGLIEIDGA